MREQAKILLLEDDPLLAAECRKALEQTNFGVDVISNGSEGFYVFHVREYALLICNIKLPGMNGLEILRKIRVQKQFVDFPVIILAYHFQIQYVYSELRKARPTYVFPRNSAGMMQAAKAVKILLCPEALAAMSLRKESDPSRRDKPHGTFIPGLPEAMDASFAFDPFTWEEETVSKKQVSGSVVNLKTNPVQEKKTPAPVITASGADKQVIEAPAKRAKSVEEVLQEVLQKISRLRRVSRLIGKTNSKENLDLRAFYNSARLLANMDCGDYEHIREFAMLVDAFILQFCENPAKVTETTTQTLARALDLMEKLILRRNDFRPDPVRFRSVAILNADASTRLMLKLAVLRFSAKPHEFENEDEVIHFLETNKVDLLVLPAELAAPSSKEVLENIREKAKDSEVPLALVAERETLSLRVQCFSEKSTVILTKPFTVLELAVRLAMAFLSPVLWNAVPAGNKEPETTSVG